jgi:hypothetical protein
MARIILILAGILELVFRGIPAFFASEKIAGWFGLEYIESALIYVHPYGALLIAFGLLLMMVSKDPLKYKIVVDIAILRFLLGPIALLYTYFTVGLFTTFWWVHLALDVVFFILLIMARPKAVAKAV